MLCADPELGQTAVTTHSRSALLFNIVIM